MFTDVAALLPANVPSTSLNSHPTFAPSTVPQVVKMPAPTALRNAAPPAEDQAMIESTPLPAEEHGELFDPQALPSDTQPAPQITPRDAGEDEVMADETGRPRFAPAIATPIAFRRELRKVPIPPHRMTPLKNSWPK